MLCSFHGLTAYNAQCILHEKPSVKVKSTPPEGCKNQLKSDSGEHRQSYVNCNHLLCTVIQPPWCNVNAGAPKASSK